MGSVYPLAKSTPSETIMGDRVGYGTPTPGRVVVEVANDNKPRVRLPTPANDNAVIRSTATAVARIAKLGLRLHPWVRAASVVADILDVLQQTQQGEQVWYDIEGLPSYAVNRLSWNPNHVDKVGTRLMVKSYPPGYMKHNLMPSTTMYPATTAANYPPGTTAAIQLQAVSGPGYPSQTRGYWACRLADNPNAWSASNRYAWLWGYRRAFTNSTPEIIPPQVTPARSAVRVPSAEPWYTPLPWTSPMPVGRPAPLPGAVPGVGTVPGREVGPLPHQNPRPNPHSPPNQPRPPTGRTKERKFAIAVGGAWAAGINFVTEGLDLVAALYKSLPKWLQNKLWKENGGYMSPYDKAQAIVKYFHLIQGDELIFNLLDMQAEDRTYGKIGGHVRNANANLIGGGGITLGYL